MGKAVTFAQQKGGAGKTTILANLAGAWAEAGRSIALVDLDPQRSLTRWAEMRDDPRLDLIESKDYRAGSDIRSAARDRDLVLVDCPGTASSLLESALRESDLVIAPCQPSIMDVWATQSVVETADALKTPIRILLNRVPARMGAMDEVMAALGNARERLLEARLGNRVAFSRSILSGRTAQELSARSIASAETTALRREIDGVLAQA